MTPFAPLARAARHLSSLLPAALCVAAAIGGCNESSAAPTAPAAGAEPSAARRAGTGRAVRAYGLILANATADAARSYGIASVSSPHSGIFCVTPAASDAAPDTTIPVMSIADDVSAANVIWTQEPEPYGCPSGAFRIVTTANDVTSAIAFTIVIP